MTMRAITIRQPWAWAIVHGGKTVENRSRNIAGAYRGPVAIHAAGTFAHDAPEHLFEACGARADGAVVGAVIGVAQLVDVHHGGDCYGRDLARLVRLSHEDREAFDTLPDNGLGGLIGKIRHCSPWAQPDVWHLVLADARPLPEPIPARGRLGLWRLPISIGLGATS